MIWAAVFAATAVQIETAPIHWSKQARSTESRRSLPIAVAHRLLSRPWA